VESFPGIRSCHATQSLQFHVGISNPPHQAGTPNLAPVTHPRYLALTIRGVFPKEQASRDRPRF
jgi:hypothetical protein